MASSQFPYYQIPTHIKSLLYMRIFNMWKMKFLSFPSAVILYVSYLCFLKFKHENFIIIIISFY